MTVYDLRIAEQVVRDTEEAVFYKEELGMRSDNVQRFKDEVTKTILSLERSPEIGANLSSRIRRKTDVKYQVIQDYILFYEIVGESVEVLRLLPARSNWMKSILEG